MLLWRRFSAGVLVRLHLPLLRLPLPLLRLRLPLLHLPLRLRPPLLRLYLRQDLGPRAGRGVSPL
jgi:hypothetical protein